jgi:DNA-binding GntR family transcriptional regulator
MPDEPAPAVTIDRLHRELRAQILSGQLPPGAPLSQVQLARALGVGRTPLREAMRMLEREGLVEASYNQRVRVASTSTAELEQIYARRIVLEAVCVRASIRLFTAAELDRLEELRVEMDAFLPDPRGQLEAWERPHLEFHRLLIAHGGSRLIDEIGHLQDHSARYRAILGERIRASFVPGAREHGLLVAACRERDRDGAAHLLARHLGRAGVKMLAAADPAHDHLVLREAVALVGPR